MKYLLIFTLLPFLTFAQTDNAVRVYENSGWIRTTTKSGAIIRDVPKEKIRFLASGSGLSSIIIRFEDIERVYDVDSVLNKNGVAYASSYAALADSLTKIFSYTTDKVATKTMSRFKDRIKVEGHLLNLWSRSTSGASPAAVSYAGSGGGGGTFYVPPGKNWWIQSITTGCSGPFWFDGVIGLGGMSSTTDQYAGVTSKFSNVFDETGGTIPQNMDLILFERGYISGGFAAYKATVTPTTSFHALGIEFTADYDFDADYNILLISDSIGWSSMGNDPDGNPYPGDSLYLFRIKKAIESEKGKKVHLINKGFGGAYSNNAVNAVKAKDYEGIEWDLLIIQLGTNDASIGASSSTFTDNINFIINNTHKNPRNPNASVVLLGPPTTDVSNRTANIGSYRTALSGLANSNSKIYYADLSTAFGLNATATADANYQISERSSGNRLHPSGKGHGLLANVIMTTVRTTAFYNNLWNK